MLSPAKIHKCLPAIALRAIALALFTVMTMQFSAVEASSRYKVDTIGGSRVPLDINDNGQVCGSWLSHPFSWDNGVFSDLQNSQLSLNQVAFGINSSGTIVGGSADGEPDFRWRAFRFDTDTDALTFEGELGWGNSVFKGINDAGVICGNNMVRLESSTKLWAVVYDLASASIKDSLEPLPGGGNSFATDISNSGHVVGNSEIIDDSQGGIIATHAFFWNGGSIIDLGVPGETSSAVAINNKDQVVGNFSSVTSTPPRNGAHIWNSGLLTKLEAFDDGLYTFARDINDSGDVVGEARDTNGEVVGVIWLSRPAYGLQPGIHRLTDIIPASLDWEVTNATAINNLGQIAGRVKVRGHTGVVRTGVVLTPEQSGFVVNSTGDASDLDPNDGRCFTGNTTADGSDECTMRAAIEQANAVFKSDTITFDIPNTVGTPTIRPQTPLPAIVFNLEIDGSTQPSSGMVEVEGASAGAGADGLSIQLISFSPPSAPENFTSAPRFFKAFLHGLVINSFSGNGINILAGEDVFIEDCFIGVGSDRITAKPNGANGILVDNARNNLIGSEDYTRSNIIANNLGAGVFVAGGRGVNIVGNNIYNNAGLGIDLAPEGVTPNDPGDLDSGPNSLTNTPVFDSFLVEETTVTVWGKIEGESENGFSDYRLDFYISVDCDTSGSGEGATPVALDTVRTDGAGLASFAVTFPKPEIPLWSLSATATFSGGTSEFSPCEASPIIGFVVNTLGDAIDTLPGDGECNTGNLTASGDPECSMRAAIMEANAKPGLDTIRFDISGGGIPVIQPGTALPEITDPVVIDGTTQPIAGKVELDGRATSFGHGLLISAGNSSVSGLLINYFGGNGLYLWTKDSNTIENLYIGVGPDGKEYRGNGGHGIYILNSSHNTIGGADFAKSSTIAYNGGAGVFVDGGSGNKIQRNSMFGNGGLGIDLAPLGVNANDTLDADSGPNGMQNYPIVDSIIATQVSSTVYGVLQSEPNKSYLLEFFKNSECDTSGFGEGLESVWTKSVFTDGDGIAEFQTTFGTSIKDSIGLSVTAMAFDDGSTSEFSACKIDTVHYIKVVDVDSDSIPNTEFELLRVSYNIPTFSDTSLGTFTTDAFGRIQITDSMLTMGDSLRVYKFLHSEPAQRHVSTLGTKFSVHLDNAKFDPLGSMYYDEWQRDTLQTIVMDHSTFAYNLLVSVEWDLDVEYHGWLQEGFRWMAHHLYDASDGQMRLDTVMILDDKKGWEEPDVRIYVDNTVWAHVAGNRTSNMNRPSGFLRGGPFEFGRITAQSPGAVLEATANPSLAHYQGADHFMTLVHEFFHYAFSLFDEYRPPLGLPIREKADYCTPMQNRSYGIMDLHFSSWQPFSSELSTLADYANAACRDNMQWYWNDKSGWGTVEAQLENRYGGIKAPILKSNERTLPTGVQYLRGPNDFGRDTDVDVMSLVVFPVSPQPTSSIRKPILVKSLDTGEPQRDIAIWQIMRDRFPEVRRKQGETNWDGRFLILGLNKLDHYSAAGGLLKIVSGNTNKRTSVKSESVWAYAEVSDTLNNTTDTTVIVLRPIAGDFPLASKVSISSDSMTVSFYAANAFSTEPKLDHYKDDTLVGSFVFVAEAEGYSVSIPFDSTNEMGTFAVRAIDSADAPFVFDIDYASYTPTSDKATLIHDPSGKYSALSLTGTTGVLKRTVMMTTSYPVSRNGLADLNRRVGKAVTISSFPANSFSEDDVISLNYKDRDLSDGPSPAGIESSLRLFKWNELALGWEELSSTVNTSANSVTGNVSGEGLYSLFTTDIATDAKEGEQPTLPQTFELHQNFPNPFNPTTVISYTLPVRAEVKIAIYNILGQKVKVFDRGLQSAGQYSVAWDATDEQGKAVASGMYFYKITAGEFTSSKKMVLLK